MGLALSEPNKMGFLPNWVLLVARLCPQGVWGLTFRLPPGNAFLITSWGLWWRNPRREELLSASDMQHFTANAVFRKPCMILPSQFPSSTLSLFGYVHRFQTILELTVCTVKHLKKNLFKSQRESCLSLCGHEKLTFNKTHTSFGDTSNRDRGIFQKTEVLR